MLSSPPPGVEAFSAVDRATGAGWKWDLSFTVATRANRRIGEAGTVGTRGAACTGGTGVGCTTVVAKSFLPPDRGGGLVGADDFGVTFGTTEHPTVRTAIWLTEAAFRVKGLFRNREGKCLPTILADKRLLDERQCHSLIVLDLSSLTGTETFAERLIR